MISYEEIFERNKEWVAEKLKIDLNYFQQLSKGQSPQYLLIGCSDSRIPPDTLTKTQPGDIFVHRNVANVVSEKDINFLAVLQYSIENLKIPHIIVCGHYDCGGVKAAYYSNARGHVKKWIKPIIKTYKKYYREITSLSSDKDRYDKLAELHVIESVKRLSGNPIIKKARKNGQNIQIHGWIVDIYTGLIKDLEIKG